ncbi:hypothetical protein O181_002982 [Austropuccinia psidii MF-1]|uniref:Uncharacterized protein n=1 Tax=Austropuccinia psidii MF-1 TaxID=1389203 RepID=A0A9Q3BDH7_9BASI|nr:hypothetical protein [Austropuccinia psidii MF-1]
MPSTRSGASYNPSSSSKKGYRCYYGRSPSASQGQGADTTTISLCGHIQSHPEGLQQCIAAQRVPEHCRFVEKQHEFLTDCDKVSGPFQDLQVTQWMSSIDGKENHDPFKSRIEEKQASITQASSKNSPSSQKQQFQCEKAATSSGKGQKQGPSHKALQPGLHNPKD